MTQSLQRGIVLALLVALMATTRGHAFSHFGPVPDASWAVFLIGGFTLGAWVRWAFPLLLALAVAIDFWVIRGQGLSFWSHYCMSPGYWLLLPAHGAMWLGGRWVRRGYGGASWPALARLVAATVVATATCHLLAQGGFYWFSDAVAQPTVAGWAKNWLDWFPSYLRATAMFVSLAAIAQVTCEQLVARGVFAPLQREPR